MKRNISLFGLIMLSLILITALGMLYPLAALFAGAAVFAWLSLRALPRMNQAGVMGWTTESAIEKSVKCTAAVVAFTIAKFGADDDTLSTATASTEDLVAVFQHATDNAADEVRVQLTGITKIKLGTGGITRGGWVTSDGTGLGVAPGAVAGTNYNCIGRALASGAASDIVPVLMMPARIQG